MSAEETPEFPGIMNTATRTRIISPSLPAHYVSSEGENSQEVFMFSKFSRLFISAAALTVLMSVSPASAMPASDFIPPATDAAVGFRGDRGVRSFEEQCYSGNGSKCYALGYFAYEEQKFGTAGYFFEKACSMESGQGCWVLGVLYSEGLKGVEKQDTAQAKDLFEKSCNLGNGSGCYDLGLFYYTGNTETEQDYGQAKDLFEKSCRLRDGNGCHVAGTIYYKGKGVDQDLRQAKYYYGKSCRLGDDAGCAMLNRLNDLDGGEES